MEGEGQRPPTTAVAHAAVDSENPWLGLASFTEETRQFFYGREEEVAELCRRVQRKLLTILFGQSGLGKTSILRAGIVPRLRPEGYCPVYVRVDYSPESPTPAEQIKQAIFRATQAAGAWSQPGTAVSGESLWEFLHHRDDVLRDASGKTLIPLLIFDQFEEIFTLAQSDDRGRQRASQFLEDLADLVENRPPKALEARFDADDSGIEQFDFARADYRILIALREDYLAHLEGVKSIMPSITQNRMRLARMTGEQALAAVLKPGGKLVSEEVAAAIVRFIAGGSELRNAEVEPSLLSLICRELNNARIAQGRSEISADLLAGSHDTILAEFYERALADQPPAVRRLIEDQLLTESGFRESLAEERLLKAFAAAGAATDALATLVDRRLLRIEERLDVRRVELTHDVLCSVVKASRDLRLAREAQEAAELELAAQRARARATRKALIRARQIAAACGVLAVVAIAGAIFGYISARRAGEAEARAEVTRNQAEQARSEAEKLIVYLLDDFYLQLEPVGRLDIVANLAGRALDYYRGLPEALRTDETHRNRALALVRFGAVLRTQDKLDDASKALAEAIEVLDGLRRKGDQSEVTAIGLALGLTAQSRVSDSQNRYSEARKLATQAAETIAPVMAATKAPSIRLSRAYGTVMNYVGFRQLRDNREDDAVKTLEASRAAFQSIDNLALTDLPAAASYTESSAWLVQSLVASGRADEARRVGEEAAVVAGRVLDKQPGHMQALRSRALMTAALGNAATDNLDNRSAAAYSEATERDWATLLAIDPSNAITLNNLLSSMADTAGALYRVGRVSESLAKGRKLLEITRRGDVGAMIGGNFSFAGRFMEVWDADAGNRAQVDADLADYRRLLEAGIKGLPSDSFAAVALTANSEFVGYLQVAAEDDAAASIARAHARIKRLDALKTADSAQERLKNGILLNAYRELAYANYRNGSYTAADAAFMKLLEIQKSVPAKTLDDRRDAMDDQIFRSMTLARLDRRDEAEQAIAPAVKFHRELAARNKDDLTQHIQFARALYASSLAGAPQGRASLKEAAALLDAMPPAMKQLKSNAELRRWIADEQRRS